MFMILNFLLADLFLNELNWYRALITGVLFLFD